MRGFMHKRSALGVCATHQKKCNEIPNRMVPPQRDGNDGDVMYVEEGNGQSITSVADTPKLISVCGRGSTISVDECVGVCRDELFYIWRHSTEHGGITSHGPPIPAGGGARFRWWCLCHVLALRRCLPEK